MSVRETIGILWWVFIATLVIYIIQHGKSIEPKELLIGIMVLVGWIVLVGWMVTELLRKVSLVYVKVKPSEIKHVRDNIFRMKNPDGDEQEIELTGRVDLTNNSVMLFRFRKYNKFLFLSEGKWDVTNTVIKMEDK